MGEPIDLERSRLLLVWLQARRALDHALSEMIAAGPAGERRVRERFELVEHLVTQADRAFAEYRDAVRGSAATGRRRWLTSADTEGEPPPDREAAGEARTEVGPGELDGADLDAGGLDAADLDAGGLDAADLDAGSEGSATHPPDSGPADGGAQIHHLNIAGRER